jgi:hypothetical protein
MNQNLLLIALLQFLLAAGSFAQVTGGKHIFSFLTLPSSARVTSLGGNIIATRDQDVSLAFANPALLNQGIHQQLSFNYNFLPAGLGYGYAAYGHALKQWDAAMHISLQSFQYGVFKHTDIYGNTLGDFKANEYAFTLGLGKRLYERLSIGANLKVVNARYESYSSLAVIGDAGAIFHDTSSQINLALVFRNFGYQISHFDKSQGEKLPYEVQLGISKKLKYLPFRFSVIYQYLNDWNIRYDNPEEEKDIPFFGEDDSDKGNTFLDNLARHFIVNGEFLFGKVENFRLRLGYNQLQRKELSVRNLRSLAGFSMGFGIKINRFRIDYGRSFTHLGAGNNHLSISTGLTEFF